MRARQLNPGHHGQQIGRQDIGRGGKGGGGMIRQITLTQYPPVTSGAHSAARGGTGGAWKRLDRADTSLGTAGSLDGT